MMSPPHLLLKIIKGTQETTSQVSQQAGELAKTDVGQTVQKVKQLVFISYFMCSRGHMFVHFRGLYLCVQGAHIYVFPLIGVENVSKCFIKNLIH